MVSLERDRFPGDDALLEVLDGRLVETDIEIASMFADQFFPAVAQTSQAWRLTSRTVESSSSRKKASVA